MNEGRATIRTQALIALAVGLVSYAAARIGVYFLIRPEGMAPFWFSNGIVVVVLLRRPMREWPLLLMAAFAGFFINMRINGFPIYPDAVYGLANVVEPLIIALLLRRADPQFDLDSIRNFGMLLASAVTGCLVAASMAWSVGPIRWSLWFIDDLLGVLLVAPVVLVFWPAKVLRGGAQRLGLPQLVEFLLLLISIGLVTTLVFLEFADYAVFHYSHAFLPFLLWAAVRFKAKGASVACLFLAAVTIGYTIQGVGPFAELSSYYIDRSLSIQIFLAINLLSYLALGVALVERDKSAEEKLKLEETVIQAQRMDSLGTMAGGIAHDFNNILTAILGSLRLIENQIAPDHPARKTLAMLNTASHRAADLVDQILTFSRKKEPRRSMIQLRPVVEEALKLLRASIPASVLIDTRWIGDGLEVFADTSSIHQIVMNLGTNAWHAMEQRGGTLGVELEAVNIPGKLVGIATESSEGRYMRLSISDTGVGIDEAVISRMFEPFFTTKEAGRGTGLGLSVVLGIIRSHGGVVQITSRIGHGTTFKLFLPVSHSIAATNVQRSEAGVDRSEGKHILLIEDEESLVNLLTSVLESAGFKVSGFREAGRALDEFCANPTSFDAVVTDHSMAVMSGLDVAQKVLAVRPELPVILMSGYVTPEIADKARILGVRSILRKPLLIDDIANAIKEIFRS